MKTKSVALAMIACVLAVLVIFVAYPAITAQSQLITTPRQTGAIQLEAHHSMQVHRLGEMQRIGEKVNLSPGQTITLTSTAGGYQVIGEPNETGTATGKLTLQVGGAFRQGYILQVTAGSITIGSTTYTVSGGSAQTGHFGINMIGQGAADNGAHFLFHERDLGKFGSTDYGILNVDLNNGSTEFAVRLLVTSSTTV